MTNCINTYYIYIILYFVVKKPVLEYTGYCDDSEERNESFLRVVSEKWNEGQPNNIINIINNPFIVNTKG